MEWLRAGFYVGTGDGISIGYSGWLGRTSYRASEPVWCQAGYLG
ncbi:hypothetical protein BMETH_761_0 [methanotrophic bacterial endosymbiont of Bathymodiolus sp.]|nr:hypothetical protein BMETH_761_0 [methanotrophic bacterial endosymbiont of Bathymodiolus sp.]